MIIARFIFSEAINKLRLLLPADIVQQAMERKRQNSVAEEKQLDSGALRDILLQEYRFMNSSAGPSTLSKDEAVVKTALEKLFLENVALETDEETAELGTGLLNLFAEVLDHLPDAPEKSLSCIAKYLNEWEVLHGKLIKLNTS
ncbi:uncharacterized protein LOC129598701 [Paramacrobiotus metropolitanus]|uniref:uncharacterized protein LOC129598701 n=1 Tax=Paramacrobiotus metropolitanus TaxID=2943436 RepID=UPI002446101F|nr:uncharacterized protein LOC129598701 [Paramacrobiotus metropolitanus]